MCVCVDQIVTHQSIIRVFAWNKCRPNRKTVRCIYFVGFHTRTLCPDDSFNQICSAHMIRFGETLHTLTQGKLKSDEKEAALSWIDDLPLNECEQQWIQAQGQYYVHAVSSDLLLHCQ